MFFDWTLSIGNLLTIFVLGAGGIGFVYTMRGRIDLMSSRVVEIEKQLTRMADVLVVQGRQDERMNAIDGRLHLQGMRIDEAISRLNLFIDATGQRPDSRPVGHR